MRYSEQLGERSKCSTLIFNPILCMNFSIPLLTVRKASTTVDHRRYIKIQLDSEAKRT